MNIQLHIKFYIISTLVVLSALVCSGQQATNTFVINPAFQSKIETYLDHLVDFISVTEISNINSDAIFLDTRELEEYEVSHIPNAIHVGYNKFKKSSLKSIPKDSHLVVYCSIGYRSEKIGAQLLRMGYTNVHNLYGGIFEWANNGRPLHSISGGDVSIIHTYNKTWSKWMENDTIQKFW